MQALAWLASQIAVHGASWTAMQRMLVSSPCRGHEQRYKRKASACALPAAGRRCAQPLLVC